MEPEEADQRLDVFLISRLGALQQTGELDSAPTRSALQKLMDGGCVKVSGENRKKNYRTKPGDLVTAELPALRELEALPQDIPINVVYEDRSLIVVDKQKGMVVHPAPGNPDGTLVNALLYHCGGELSGINGVIRPGIVHRIDKDTSGLLVAAKTDHAHRGLAEQFFCHSIKRSYIALIRGHLMEPAGTIDSPIGRDSGNRKRFISGVIGGKRAVTHYRVLEEFPGYSLLELRLETGRTHQIRVHLSGLGHPLAGDELYGGERGELGLRGQCLHAATLGFQHPESGEYMEFRSPLPEDFEDALKRLSRGLVK